MTAATAGAQCIDGTPPPCASARVATARAVPGPEARARRFLLLPFRNVSRAAPQEWLVKGAPLMLEDALSQYADIYVVPEQQLTAARRRIGVSADSIPDAVQTRRLVEDTGGWTVVTGNVIATGGRLRVSLQAVDATTSRTVAHGDADVAIDADIRPAFDRLTVSLVEPLGVRGAKTDIAALTTKSVDAYRAYVRGVDLTQRSAFRDAQAAFSEAVQRDSMFALAWARLAFVAFAGNSSIVMDLQSPAYAASARAAQYSSRLPPRQGQLVRALSLFFQGQVTRALSISDSLIATDPDDLDAREQAAMIELFDPILDTNKASPRHRGSWNRSMQRVREVLERDPGRRHIYAVFAFAYGSAGGLWHRGLPGFFQEGPIFSYLRSPDVFFNSVLRDTIVQIADAEYYRMPIKSRDSLRLVAADVAMRWVERWLAAGPGDADAHIWASRITELQKNYSRALREVAIAESLGVQSSFEFLPGRRMALLVRARQYTQANALADSLQAAGRLFSRSFDRTIDRTRAYGVAAQLLAKRYSIVAKAADEINAQSTGPTAWCRVIANELSFTDLDVLRAAVDTGSLHFAELIAVPSLAPCALDLATGGFVGDDRDRPAASRALLTVADSLRKAGDMLNAYRAARGAGYSDAQARPSIVSGIHGPVRLFLSKQFSFLALVADSVAAGGSTGCFGILSDLRRAPPALMHEVMDTAAIHFTDVSAYSSLAPCAESYARTIVIDSSAGTRSAIAEALLPVADSLQRAGKSVLAYTAARIAWYADTARRSRLRDVDWFTRKSRELAVASRFTPAGVRVEGDSVTVSFALTEPGPLLLSSAGFAQSWDVETEMRAVSGADTTSFVVYISASRAANDSTIRGPVSAFIAASRDRSAYMYPRIPAVPEVSPAVTSTVSGFRMVVHGPFVAAIQRLRPANAVFSATPCIAVTEGLCTRRTVPIEYR